MDVVIADYDPEWPVLFDAERRRLEEGLGDVAVRVEHVGSTAVPGLAAKPVIDIQVSVRSFEPFDAYARPLADLGYLFRTSDDDDPAHRFFKLEQNGVRRFHIHVCEAGGEWERRHLAFREHLRRDTVAAREYEAVKRALAARFPHDSLAYADAKTPYIRTVEQRIRA